MQLQSVPSPPKTRINSIDILRGLVMIIMALDHTRDFFHISADPNNLQTTTPILFFTRWITDFCAPVFVFLSGTSAFLTGRKRTKNELAAFLFKRGLWLVFVEVAVFNLFLTFDPTYSFIAVQVLWVIGLSMIILAGMIYLPVPVIVAIGLLIICSHNIFDVFDSARPASPPWWLGFLHQQSFYPYGNHRMFAFLYPLIPWPGVMMIGYAAGKFYEVHIAGKQRQKTLLLLGIAVTVVFVLLRATNFYGDPSEWQSQKNGIFTALSFLNTTKYPPSLLFLLMTLGPALIVLSLAERAHGKWTKIVTVYGRVPFFYFLVHFFILHLGLTIVFFLSGHTLAQSNTGLIHFRPDGFGYSLGTVYLIWITVVTIMYPLCKKYDRLKSSHKYWWLSYL